MIHLWGTPDQIKLYGFYTLSGRIGKVVASRASVARSIPAEVALIYTIHGRGRVDDLSFLEYLTPFCFLSIEFHSTFSISYKILPHFVYY